MCVCVSESESSAASTQHSPRRTGTEERGSRLTHRLRAARTHSPDPLRRAMAASCVRPCVFFFKKKKERKKKKKSGGSSLLLPAQLGARTPCELFSKMDSVDSATCLLRSPLPPSLSSPPSLRPLLTVKNASPSSSSVMAPSHRSSPPPLKLHKIVCLSTDLILARYSPSLPPHPAAITRLSFALHAQNPGIRLGVTSTVKKTPTNPPPNNHTEDSFSSLD